MTQTTEGEWTVTYTVNDKLVTAQHCFTRRAKMSGDEVREIMGKIEDVITKSDHRPTWVFYTGKEDNASVRKMVEDRTESSGPNNFFVVGETNEGLQLITDLGQLSVLPGDCVSRKESDHRVWVSRITTTEDGRYIAEENSL